MKLNSIVKKSQPALKQALVAELKRMEYKPIVKNGFVYAKGQVPVMLVAHLDTVHKTPVEVICYSADGRIIMSPEGIGGDDRCGVYMILQIIKKHRCHVLFCEDEEIGCVGADKFTLSGIKPKVNYIVELDRRGSNDAVFYDCDNPEFTDFVTEFGFVEAIGSFSDIALIAPHLGVAAVNISAGYFNEHTRHEYIDLRAVRDNIRRVARMAATETGRFEYIEAVYATSYYGTGGYDYTYLSGYDKKCVIKSLMEIPKDGYILDPTDKKPEYGDGYYYIDSRQCVYEYMEHIDVMVEMDGYSAFDKDGLAVKFSLKKAYEYEVVSEECAYAMEDAYFNSGRHLRF